MIGISLSMGEIETAPRPVRDWLYREIASTHGHDVPDATSSPADADRGTGADIRLLPAVEPPASRKIEMQVAGKKADSEAIHQLIAERAYELWENEGRPHGFELRNWHQAEQEILSCINGETRPGRGGPPAASNLGS